MPYPEQHNLLVTCPHCKVPVPVPIGMIDELFMCPHCTKGFTVTLAPKGTDVQPIDPRHIC